MLALAWAYRAESAPVEPASTAFGAVIQASGFASAEFTHRGIRVQGIDMGHLFPELPWRPPHRMACLVVLDHMAPVAAAALRAEQLLEPLIAQHQHRIGVDDQPCLSVVDSPLLELLRGEEMQEILPAVALDPLVRMDRAEQLPTPRTSAAGSWSTGTGVAHGPSGCAPQL